MDVDRVSLSACELGESPLWDHRSARLPWIDAWHGHVHAFDLLSRATSLSDFSGALGGIPIGAIGLHAAGGLVASAPGGFYHLDIERGSARLIAEAERDRPATNRLNDGKGDRAGRFWSASVNTVHRTPSGALWCLEADRAPMLKQDGLVVGNGIACAIVLDRHDRFNRIISPFLTAFNSMPRIALGPLFILWFGIGIASKVVLAFSLGFFIMLLSTLGGLKNVDRDLLLMSRLFGADETRLFRHVRFPWALPSVFAGLKLTLIYCSAGAVIGEMIAARSGLGVLLQSYSGRFDVAGVLALIFLVAMLVMVSTSLLELVESRLLSWSKGSTDVP